ncbi:SIS domain-containing protein [Streptomyces sp. DH37]|uniref:D-sedoheptulose-7-phosphate isomerase n=1 Tax=Streptomyces sp. DH37 TaxID=3040122 RepID=UPI002441E14A|nr:SIS domain-containing protein [Streptomyces sp. DH37]MDG9701284.1 SIS domain-containing protein [Streptomyces sp. DH37]
MTTPKTAKSTLKSTAESTARSTTGTAGNGTRVRRTRPAPEPGPVAGHCDELLHALVAFRDQAGTAQRWGERLAGVLAGGGRLLVAGNGGSAAQAQHLTAELVGRYRDDRPPFSAIALHADTSSTTAIANDYGVDEVFARQVRAHGREGDVLMLLSTSGASANLLSAAEAGRGAGMAVWALTGPAPNPLAAGSDESLCVRAGSTATVQELHLVAVHMVCAAFDAALEDVLEDVLEDRLPGGGSANDDSDA